MKRNPTGGSVKILNTSDRRSSERSSTHLCADLSQEEGGVWEADRKNTVKLLALRNEESKARLSTPYQKRSEFSNWKEVTFKGHFLEGEFRDQDSKTFVLTNVRLKEKYSKRKMFQVKKGKTYELTKKVNTPVYEMTCDLSNGLSSILNDLSKTNPQKVKAISMAAVRKAEVFLKELTKSNDGSSSWVPFSGTCHPDAFDKLSFHFQLATVNEDNILVGRSANRVKGKVGLRTLGPAFLNILRHSQYVNVPEDLLRTPKLKLAGFKTGKADDFELASFMEAAVKESIKEVGLQVNETVLRSINLSYASKWLKKRKVMDKIPEVESISLSNESLLQEVAELKKMVKNLEEQIKTFKNSSTKDYVAVNVFNEAMRKKDTAISSYKTSKDKEIADYKEKLDVANEELKIKNQKLRKAVKRLYTLHNHSKKNGLKLGSVVGEKKVISGFEEYSPETEDITHLDHK